MTRSQHAGLCGSPEFTPHRVNVAADDVAVYTGIKAELDLATLGAGNLDTVVRSKTVGVQGNSITVQATGDRTDGTVVLVETTTACHIHYDDDVSTVADVEAALAASTLIEVKTAGTAITVLDAATDDFVATPLAAGEDAIPKLHGMDSTDWNEVVAAIDLDGTDLDIKVLLWNSRAAAFVDQEPAVAFNNITANKQIRFTTGGQRFFIHCSGTFTRVDIDCAGAALV